MKKILLSAITVTLLVISNTSNASWFFDDNDWECMGPFGKIPNCNPYDEWDPRYWMEEMDQEFNDDDYYGPPPGYYGGGPGYGGPGPYGPPPGYYGGPRYGGSGPYGPPPGYAPPPPRPQTQPPVQNTGGNPAPNTGSGMRGPGPYGPPPGYYGGPRPYGPPPGYAPRGPAPQQAPQQ